MCVLGIAAIFSGTLLFTVIGLAMVLLGLGLIVHYLTFGLFYDQNSFLLTSFKKKEQLYRYADIQSQQLYNNMGHIIIELHLKDGETILLQTNMTGVYDFMDKAFHAWLVQTGKTLEDCPFYDPDNSCWFPPVED